MRYALSTYQYVDERLSPHILDQILSAGFHEIEIFGARQHLEYHNPIHVRDVAQWFWDHGVSLFSMHGPLYNDAEWGRLGGMPVSICHLERRQRIDSMDEIKRVIDVADHLPFRYLILHMGVPNEEYDLRKFDAAMTSLEHLNIYAKQHGVELLLENIPNELATPERMVQFLQYSRLDLKICFDTGHAHMTCGVREAYGILRQHIASTHIHDNHREKDEHLMPFEGGINWQRTVHDFRAADDRFPILFELRDYGPDVTTLARVADVIQRMDGIE